MVLEVPDGRPLDGTSGTGIYKLSEIPPPPPMTLWQAFPEWEKKIQFAPQTVSVFTGHPGHGKTTLAAQVWFEVAKRHDIRIAFASMETRARPHQQRNIRQFYHRQLDSKLTEPEQREADDWIDEHFRWLQHPYAKPNIVWLLGMIEAAAINHGCKVVVVDPWNRLERSRPEGMSETDYIGDCLDDLSTFANQLDVHIQILAHPAKMDSRSRGQPPTLEDIAGSKNWDNKTDQGLVIHREKVFEDGVRCTDAILLQRKTRFEELGFPCCLGLRYNLSTGCFESTDYDQFAGS